MTPMDGIALYPLKFVPVYKTRIWGGTQLTEVLKRHVPQTEEPVGEAWEISAMPSSPGATHFTPSTVSRKPYTAKAEP